MCLFICSSLSLKWLCYPCLLAIIYQWPNWIVILKIATIGSYWAPQHGYAAKNMNSNARRTWVPILVLSSMTLGRSLKLSEPVSWSADWIYLVYKEHSAWHRISAQFFFLFAFLDHSGHCMEDRSKRQESGFHLEGYSKIDGISKIKQLISSSISEEVGYYSHIHNNMYCD